MQLDGATILVTGANGFVGTHVCRRLADSGARVRALVRRPGETPELRREAIHEHGGSFTDPSDAAEAVAGADALVHCAAAIGADLEDARAVNRDGTATIVAAAAAAGLSTLVHVSTCAVYADPKPDVVDESSPMTTDEEAAYAVTKAEAEQAAHEEADGARLVILRPPVILGAGPTSVWGTHVPRRIRDDGWTLRGGSDGETLAWVHVDDLADAVVRGLTTDVRSDATYNVVGGHARWSDYVEAVRSWFDDAPPAEVTDGPAWRGRYATAAIEADLGWSPSVGFEEAMAEIERSWREAGAADQR